MEILLTVQQSIQLYTKSVQIHISLLSEICTKSYDHLALHWNDRCQALVMDMEGFVKQTFD